MIWSSLIFNNKLLMLIWIKCKPHDVKILHSFKHCSLCWWLGPGFRLISPESNISKWKFEFKFLYSSLEAIKSTVYSSNQKLKTIPDIHELRCKKSWSGTCSHVVKEIWRIFVFKKQKSQTLQEKKNIFLTFLSLFGLHQTSKNKKVTGNIINNSSEVVLLCRQTVWVISLSTLTWASKENIK